MKKPTQKYFLEETVIIPKLARAVIRQMGGWNSFVQAAPDIASHGIDGGFHGFIYKADTEAFAKRNRKEIAAMASAQAEDFGTGVFEMIRGFGCFRHDKNKPTDKEIGNALYAGKDMEGGMPILNALAWYAGEEVARSYCDMCEQEEEKL